jgi:hypothetical protein
MAAESAAAPTGTTDDRGSTGLDAVDQQLVDRSASRARVGGLQLAAAGGLL